MGKILEGFWDCKYCDSTHIRGGVRVCPNCGKARDENTVFYLDKNKITYVPKEKSAHINRNPDWVCNYCDQLNSDDEKVCAFCAAPRTEKNLNYFENRNKKELDKEEKVFYDVEDRIDDSSDKSYYSNTYLYSNNTKNNTSSIKDFILSHLIYILFSLFTILGIVALVFLFLPKEEEITINQVSWERSINIERYQTVEESDWSLPSNARLLYSREEFSHYQNVLDHYETKTREVAKERITGYEEYVTGYRDLGNGYFEEITSSRPIYETYYETETYQEPVYRTEAVYMTKYYYEIDKWLYERSISTSGNDKNPYWGEFTLASDERVSSKSESYSITGLNQKKKEETIRLSFEDWNSLNVGQTVKLKISLGYGEIVE